MEDSCCSCCSLQPCKPGTGIVCATLTLLDDRRLSRSASSPQRRRKSQQLWPGRVVRLRDSRQGLPLENGQERQRVGRQRAVCLSCQSRCAQASHANAAGNCASLTCCACHSHRQLQPHRALASQATTWSPTCKTQMQLIAQGPATLARARRPSERFEAGPASGKWPGATESQTTDNSLPELPVKVRLPCIPATLVIVTGSCSLISMLQARPQFVLPHAIPRSRLLRRGLQCRRGLGDSLRDSWPAQPRGSGQQLSLSRLAMRACLTRQTRCVTPSSACTQESR